MDSDGTSGPVPAGKAERVVGSTSSPRRGGMGIFERGVELMERPGSMGSITSARQTGGHTYSSRSARTLAGVIALGLGSMLTSTAKAQPPEPQVGDITQRSGL